MVLFVSCEAQMNRYNLNKPSKYVSLPKVLNEVSGLCYLNDSSLACVQDEQGIIFILDINSGEIEEEIYFKTKGDFEGIAKVGESFFVLESNGTLYQVSGTGERKFKFPSKGVEFEGLCYDKHNERLLLACKQDKGKDRHIKLFAFDLQKKKHIKEPVLKLKKNNVHENFKASGIAIHPNGDIFLVSSVAKSLLQLSSTFDVINVAELNPFIFHQPEGICFNNEGDMFISNEKNDGVANVLNFKYLYER
jgi:uncharacterized protein YjiK